MEIICLDTNILLWSNHKRICPGQEELALRASAFLSYLRKNGARAIVPAIVIAEFLTAIPQEEHDAIVAKLKHRFMIAPFDIVASMWYARLFLSRSKHEKSVLKEQNGVTHKEMLADHMIIAIALAQRASCIYTEDTHLASFAQGHIEVRGIPAVPHQIPFNLDGSTTE